MGQSDKRQVVDIVNVALCRWLKPWAVANYIWLLGWENLDLDFRLNAWATGT